MLKSLLACLLAAAPAAALTQTADVSPGQAQPVGRWIVAGGPGGCIAHSASTGGTVVSILAKPNQATLLFMVQNRAWSSLRDGERIPLAVGLEGGRQDWRFEAIAKQELDSDGPGYLFVVPPSAPFLAAFAEATGVQFGQGGRSLASIPLENSEAVLTNLAQCMAQMMSGGQVQQPGGSGPNFIRTTDDAVPL